MLKSRGFTAVEVVLVLVVVGALGFAGWTWWSMQQNQEESVKQTQTSQQAEPDHELESSIEEVGEDEYLIKGVVTATFNDKPVDGDAGVVIDDQYRVTTEVARENQLMEETPKGEAEQLEEGDEAEALVLQESDDSYTIYGKEKYYLKKSN